MPTRRSFLSLTGKSLGLAALSSATVASLLKNVEAATKTVAQLTPQEAATDEDYWATIQNSFSVTRGIINLNNGGVSPSPRIVTEALVRYIWEQEDATAYTMWQILEPQSETIRTGLAELFGCDREEMAITRNASESLETLLMGMDFKPGAAEDTNFDRLLQPAEDLNGNGAMDGFTVTWEENGIAGGLAQWLPGSQQLQINGTINWFFGGAGNIPAGQTDFETIMLHEEGHILGLNHINTGTADDIMRADIVNQAQAAGTMGVRTPDIGSLFGAVTLYTQPTPEPGTVLMFATGLLGLLGYGWRRKKPAA